MTALQVGHAERTKATVHAVLGLAAGVSAVYNVCAFLARKEPEWHLLLNAGLYTLLGTLEAKRVQQHWCQR